MKKFGYSWGVNCHSLVGKRARSLDALAAAGNAKKQGDPQNPFPLRGGDVRRRMSEQFEVLLTAVRVALHPPPQRGLPIYDGGNLAEEEASNCGVTLVAHAKTFACNYQRFPPIDSATKIRESSRHIRKNVSPCSMQLETNPRMKTLFINVNYGLT